MRSRAGEGRYAKRNVFITGGSSGIGLAVAEAFAAEGAHVAIFARNPTRLEEAVARIRRVRNRGDEKAAGFPLDVADRGQVRAVMERAVREFGAPQVLVNDAGITYTDYFENITYEQFDEILRTKLYGVWNTITTLLPDMKAHGGLIVNVSSIVGFLGVFGYAAYAASKFGIVGLSETLRMELKRYGIRVCVLCPPDTDTPQWHGENRTKPGETRALSGNAKVMKPEAVARALLEGIRKGRFMIIPGAEGKFIYAMKRHFPVLVARIMDRDVRKAAAKAG